MNDPKSAYIHPPNKFFYELARSILLIIIEKDSVKKAILAFNKDLITLGGTCV